LPKRVQQEVRRYLDCGILSAGFVHVKCEACQDSLLVGFSCKTRGWCPSCGARRAEETAAHCGEVLPKVGYRQWTLSLPWALRWPVVKTPRLLRAVERRLVRSVWRWQRREAKRLGERRELSGGAVGFAQLLGSALQLTPHLHVLLPDGLWAGADFVALPPPSDGDVAAVLRRLVLQLAKDFEGAEAGWPDDALEALQSEGVQHRLSLGELHGVRPRRAGRRVAVVQGFSLHADTQVHAQDRAGLERLCRYGSRGPVAEERLSRLEDGRYAYRTRRGPTLVLTAAQLVKRLVALIPPRGTHLTCFHGVLAPNARLRPVVTLAPPAATAAPVTLTRKPRRPRLDWATLQQRTFGVDVWTCRCGGKRKVLAIITHRRTALEVLENLGLLQPRPPLPTAQSPPQLPLGV